MLQMKRLFSWQPALVVQNHPPGASHHYPTIIELNVTLIKIELNHLKVGLKTRYGEISSDLY